MILGIAGALRAGSFNRKLLIEALRIHGGPSSVADLRLPLYDGDLEDAEGIPPTVQTLFDQIAAADAVVISTPEYNKSIPGGLKNALDWVSRVKGNAWAGKPVAIMSAAGGREGGARSQMVLRLSLNPFRPRLLPGPELMVAGASKEFDENGRLISDRYLATLTDLMDALKAEVAREKAFALRRSA